MSDGFFDERKPLRDLWEEITKGGASGPGWVKLVDIAPGIAEASRRMQAGWYVIRTSPPCLVNRETGEIWELPELPDGPCSRCGVRHA